MVLLALDTSESYCSVALSVDGTIFQDHQQAPRKQSECLLPMVDDLLRSASLKPQDLSGIAVGQGPGQFTGVRIAVSVAQGLALAHELAVYPVSSLRALAQSAHQQWGYRQVLAAIDARMGEVYWGRYAVDATGVMQTVTPDALASPEVLSRLLEDDEAQVGSAFQAYADRAVGTRACQPEACVMAKAVLTLALEAREAGHFQASHTLSPVYLRQQVTQAAKKL